MTLLLYTHTHTFKNRQL